MSIQFLGLHLASGLVLTLCLHFGTDDRGIMRPLVFKNAKKQEYLAFGRKIVSTEMIYVSMSSEAILLSHGLSAHDGSVVTKRFLLLQACKESS